MSGRGSGRTRRTLDLTNPGTLGAVTRRAGLSAKPGLGQNFLVDRQVLTAIVDALEPGGSDVLEIGPGIGTLTIELARLARRVVAVDLDPRCIRASGITLRRLDNVLLIEADALTLSPAEAGMAPPYLVAGNIPYNITGAIIQHLLDRSDPPVRAVLLVQREVAIRLSASDGGDEEEWSLATIAVRSLAGAERIADVPPASFDPSPAVHSSILRLTPTAPWPPGERQRVLDLARPAFQLRRKTLRHGLSRALAGDEQRALRCLEAAGVDPGRRPGTVTLAEWRRLAGIVGGTGRTAPSRARRPARVPPPDASGGADRE